MKLALAEEMRRLDHTAMAEYGIPGLVLMENAGRGTVAAMASHFGDLAGLTVAVVAGPGNNGGDGLVIARHLLQRGGQPRVFLLSEPDKLSGDAAANLAMVRRLAIPLTVIATPEEIPVLASGLQGCRVIVDAIFGTGLKRELRGHYAAAVASINVAGAPVVSADLPSGLDSDTGRVLGACVRATLTATYGLAKPGHFLGQGPEATGVLEVIDISLPAQAVHAARLTSELLTATTVRPWLPARPRAAHKGTFGHLLVIAGSRGKGGAALLCCRGALRAGAGLVSLAAPAPLADRLIGSMPEAMTISLAATDADFAGLADLAAIMAELPGKSALVIGPGLGQAPAIGQLVAELYSRVPLPMVVDADALNVLAAQGVELKGAAGPRILTPHPGEMSRLTGLTSSAIQAERLATAREFAARHQLWLVLKGAGTVIAAPDGRLAINGSGNQLLAAGGSGDVLAGLIGSLLAQGVAPWQAAGLGVFAHGLAADHLRDERRLSLGLLASELADNLPGVLSRLHESNHATAQKYDKEG